MGRRGRRGERGRKRRRIKRGEREARRGRGEGRARGGQEGGGGGRCRWGGGRQGADAAWDLGFSLVVAAERVGLRPLRLLPVLLGALLQRGSQRVCRTFQLAPLSLKLLGDGGEWIAALLQG